MKKHYLVYQITNLINEKIYIGKHETFNVDDGYMGSGKLLGRAQEKYGIENFKKEILFNFNDFDEMDKKEAELVNEEFIARDDTYNIMLGGTGGWQFVNSKLTSKNRNDARIIAIENGLLENAQKSLKELRKDPNWCKLAREQISKGLKLYYKKGNNKGHFTGLKHTDETKEKIGKANSVHQKGEGNSNFGKMWIYNEILKESTRINKEEEIPEGWKKGRVLNWDTFFKTETSSKEKEIRKTR